MDFSLQIQATLLSVLGEYLKLSDIITVTALNHALPTEKLNLVCFVPENQDLTCLYKYPSD